MLPPHPLRPPPPQTHTYVCSNFLKRTKSQEFEREQGGLFGNLWVKEMK